MDVAGTAAVSSSNMRTLERAVARVAQDQFLLEQSFIAAFLKRAADLSFRHLAQLGEDAVHFSRQFPQLALDRIAPELIARLLLVVPSHATKGCIGLTKIIAPTEKQQERSFKTLWELYKADLSFRAEDLEESLNNGDWCRNLIELYGDERISLIRRVHNRLGLRKADIFEERLLTVQLGYTIIRAIYKMYRDEDCTENMIVDLEDILGYEELRDALRTRIAQALFNNSLTMEQLENYLNGPADSVFSGRLLGDLQMLCYTRQTFLPLV